MTAHEGKDRPILFFIGLVLLLVGLYGSLRTVVNLVAFDRYPQQGVFYTPVSPTNYAPYEREEDCAVNNSYLPPLYYEDDGVTLREPSPTETEADAQYKAQQERYAANCVAGVQESRAATMVNDISQSLIFLLLAIGVLVFSRVFKRFEFTLKI